MEERFRRKLRDILGMIDVFITLLVVMLSQVYTHGKTCKASHFKYMQFTVSQSWPNKAVIFKMTPSIQ